MPSSIDKDNMFPLALIGVLALGGLCTIDPSLSPPSTLEEIVKYGELRNSCSIFVLVFHRQRSRTGEMTTAQNPGRLRKRKHDLVKAL